MEVKVNTKYDVGQVIKFKEMTLTIRSIDVRVQKDGTVSVWGYNVEVEYKDVTKYKTLNTENIDSIIKANEALRCTLSFVENMHRMYRHLTD